VQRLLNAKVCWSVSAGAVVAWTSISHLDKDVKTKKATNRPVLVLGNVVTGWSAMVDYAVKKTQRFTTAVKTSVRKFPLVQNTLIVQLLQTAGKTQPVAGMAGVAVAISIIINQEFVLKLQKLEAYVLSMMSAMAVCDVKKTKRERQENVMIHVKTKQNIMMTKQGNVSSKKPMVPYVQPQKSAPVDLAPKAAVGMGQDTITCLDRDAIKKKAMENSVPRPWSVATPTTVWGDAVVDAV